MTVLLAIEIVVTTIMRRRRRSMRKQMMKCTGTRRTIRRKKAELVPDKVHGIMYYIIWSWGLEGVASCKQVFRRMLRE